MGDGSRMFKILIFLLFLTSCSSDLTENKLISVIKQTNDISGWEVVDVKVTSIVDERELGKQLCYDVKYSYGLTNTYGCYKRGTDDISNNVAVNFVYKVIQSKRFNKLYEDGACWGKKDIESSISKMKESNKKLLGKTICLDSVTWPLSSCKNEKKVDQDYIDDLNIYAEHEIYKDVNSWLFIEPKSKVYNFNKHRKICYIDSKWKFKD